MYQTYKDIEVIIVDDGSCEETALICDEIAAKDNRIRLIHKKNEGVSIARNIGLSMVTGEYVGFVDSDDWIDADMFENLVREIEKYDADIVMCDATTVARQKETLLYAYLKVALYRRVRLLLNVNLNWLVLVGVFYIRRGS